MAGEKRTVAVSALKASLSRYLRQVKGGEEVIVTERERPIAKLVPIGPGAAHAGRLRELEREGRIRLGSGKLPADFWRLRRPKDPKGLVRAALEQERDLGR